MVQDRDYFLANIFKIYNNYKPQNWQTWDFCILGFTTELIGDGR